jgi:hypothetical protein
MQRISLSWFADLGPVLGKLANPVGSSEITLFDLYEAERYLLPLASEQNYPLDIRASRPVINQLLTLIGSIINEADKDKQTQILGWNRYNIWDLATRIRELLRGELAVQPVYHIWPKRAYNIEVLIAEGERLFSEAVRKELNDEERFNIREAGKCLVFEVPTAAAFHIFRCAESLLRRYYEVVVGTLPKKKMRNWALYINQLRKCGADPIVVTILEQIKDLHRNPVIHPETKLQTDEALSLIGIIDSALNAMVNDMKKRREQTSPSLPGLDLSALASEQKPQDTVEIQAAPATSVEIAS